MNITDIPRTIEECCQYLDEFGAPEIRQYMRSNPMEKAEAYLHGSLGRRIRNSWGLWDQSSQLYSYLSALGFQHPEDMSGIIIHFYWKHCNGQPWDDLDEIIRKYREYWAGISGIFEKTRVNN